MRMAFEWQIKERLGVPKKLPADFAMAPVRVDVAPEPTIAFPTDPFYVYVHINPSVSSKERRKVTHRVMAQCPACRKEMSMGRLNQHFPCKEVK